jgi:hypothetical protein
VADHKVKHLQLAQQLQVQQDIGQY